MILQKARCLAKVYNVGNTQKDVKAREQEVKKRACLKSSVFSCFLKTSPDGADCNEKGRGEELTAAADLNDMYDVL